MSIADVTDRIAQIQAQLAVLAPPSTSTTSATDFSDALRAVSRPGTTTTGGTAAGDAVVARARSYLGVPYVWGGSDPERGLDCSGLVQRVYADLGYDLPRVSYEQARAGRPVASLAEAQPGDVLAFGSPVHHVGIYLGDGQMIEAPRPGLAVRVGPVYETPTAIRRIVPDAVDGSYADGTPAVVPLGTPYARLFEAAGAEHGVSPRLLAAVARQESGFDPRAVSPAGARGLMQLMPGTADGLGVTDPFDPGQAVDGAARLLRTLIDRFGGTELALAAYNAGPGAVLRYGGVPPYPETRAYVRAVLSQVVAA
jgi:Transglycosylase SLT domain/NlpC/P60 family